MKTQIKPKTIKETIDTYKIVDKEIYVSDDGKVSSESKLEVRSYENRQLSKEYVANRINETEFNSDIIETGTCGYAYFLDNSEDRDLFMDTYLYNSFANSHEIDPNEIPLKTWFSYYIDDTGDYGLWVTIYSLPTLKDIALSTIEVIDKIQNRKET